MGLLSEVGPAPAVSPRVALARAEAFLESALVARADEPTALAAMAACDAAGEVAVAREIERVAENSAVSGPVAAEAAGGALALVRYRRALHHTSAAPGPGGTVIGSLRIAPGVPESLEATAHVLGRRAELARLALEEPDRLLAMVGSGGRDKDVVWAVGLVAGDRAVEAARALLAGPRRDRSTSDSLARLEGIDPVLESVAADEAVAPEVRAFAASALVRRGSLERAATLEQSEQPAVAEIGAAARALLTGDASNSRRPDRAPSGLEAWLALALTSDALPLTEWASRQGPERARSLGVTTAGWPHENELVDLCVERLGDGSRRPAWEAMLAGIDPPGLASRLMSDGGADASSLTSTLASFDARLAALDVDAGATSNNDGRAAAADVPVETRRPTVELHGAPSADDRRVAALASAGDVDALSALASSNDPAAARALAGIDDPSARRCEELLLLSPYPAIAEAAAWCVARRGPAGARYGRQLIATERSELVIAGLRILGRCPLDDVRDSLVRELRGSNPWIVRQAVESAARAGAASADRALSRAVLGTLETAAGGSAVIVPAVAAIGNEAAMRQLRELNENGHIFPAGRDDAALEELIASARTVVAEEAAERERIRAESVARWRAEGRLEAHSRGRAEGLLDRLRGRGRGGRRGVAGRAP